MGTMITLGVGKLEISWGKIIYLITSVICFNPKTGKTSNTAMLII